MVLITENDPRGPKAVSIATDAGQWLKCRTRDGRKAYGIRSSRDANVVYFTTRTSCTCYDGQRRTCKHQLAVQLHCELVAEQDGRKVTRTAPGVCATCGGTDQHDLDTHRQADIFSRFDDDSAPLARILGKPRRSVIPAALLGRED